MKLTISLFALVIAICLNQGFSQSITIATWNIEHLGSSGRGFPENKGLKPRTNTQLIELASLIRDSLSLEIVCAQEIAISKNSYGKYYSSELDQITKYLGPSWKYYVPEISGKAASMQNAFIYNNAAVNLVSVSEMNLTDTIIGKAKLFDRKPLVGYFYPINGKDGFVIINLHLASGKHNFSNHFFATKRILNNLGNHLKKNKITNEKDIIILGDLNDNPFEKKANGNCCKYPDDLYTFMAQNGYLNLVNASFISTRMDAGLVSIIDHIFVSSGAKQHINQSQANIFRPSDLTSSGRLKWRSTYSDHFPIYFEFDFFDQGFSINKLSHTNYPETNDSLDPIPIDCECQKVICCNNNLPELISISVTSLQGLVSIIVLLLSLFAFAKYRRNYQEKEKAKRMKQNKKENALKRWLDLEYMKPHISITVDEINPKLMLIHNLRNSTNISTISYSDGYKLGGIAILQDKEIGPFDDKTFGISLEQWDSSLKELELLISYLVNDRFLFTQVIRISIFDKSFNFNLEAVNFVADIIDPNRFDHVNT